jgi:hypothetical protein
MRFTVPIALVSLALSPAANALLISADWKTAGDGLITQDTASGLSWLDMTVTADKSYNTVSSQLGVGGSYEGWRYANDDEVAALYTAAGVPVGFLQTDLTVFANAKHLVDDLLGRLNPVGDYYHYFQAMLHGDNDSATEVTRAVVEVSVNLPALHQTNAGINWHTWDKTWTHRSVASFLVRETLRVPEPSTMLLLSAGLFAVALTRRRRALGSL